MLDKLEEILTRHNVFLSGGAGVGKSFLVRELKNSYERQGKRVVALGSSALSALNVGGVTLHSFFCFGRCAGLEELNLYDKHQKRRLTKLKILKKLDLIIIDEISMVSAELWDMVAFRVRNFGFEGKFLVVGDFFQLPPVAKERQNSLFVSSYYAFSSLFWEDLAFKNLSLSTSKRTQNTQFYDKLSLLRQGILNDELLEYFESFVFNPNNLEDKFDDFTLLCGVNKRVDWINEQGLSRIKNTLFSFKATLKVEDKSLTQTQLHSWVKGLNIVEELKVKVGARVIFTLNNFDKGYFNGEQGVVSEILEEDRQVRIRIAKNNGCEILLEPHTYLFEEFGQIEEEIFITTRASVIQFPIKLAYAITIHKSQGMGIEKLICDIDHIFEDGQLYVALSRAIDPKNLKILYSKNLNFKAYFVNVLKINESVKAFYEENQFLNLESC